MFATVNIKELLDLTSQSCNTRERALGSLPANRAFNSDQVISLTLADGCNGSVHPGPGLMKSQATSKSQAASVKLSNQPGQLTSGKHPNHNHKRQASSLKLQAH